MDLDSNSMDLAIAIMSGGLVLLALSSWRMRRTSIGRSHLALIVLTELSALSYLAASRGILDYDSSLQLNSSLYVVISAVALRLGLKTVDPSRRLGLRSELFVWLPTLLLFALRSPSLGALWTSFAFVFASLRFAGLPLRSWPGYRVALFGVSGAMLLPTLVPLGWLAGWTPETLGVLARFVFLGLVAALYYGLPRLGLVSADRVQHGTVIEAMSDGVLVVDMSGRLIDFNQAARKILALEDAGQASRPLSQALAHHPDLIEFFSGAIDGRSLYTPCSRTDGDSAEAKAYDLQLSALRDSSGAVESRVLVLRDISDRVAIEREHRRQSRHVRLVHEVSATVHEADSIDAGLDAALALIARTMGFGLGHFLKSQEAREGNSLVPSGIVYRADGEGEAATIDPRGVAWWKDQGLASTYSVPVLIGRRLYGVFELFSKEKVVVDAVSSEMLEHVGDLVGRAIERKLAEEKIRRLAYRDDLTGLPNRQRFHQLLAGAVSLADRGDRHMALLFLDLDGFKKINDTMGHEVGDRLLTEVASRFSRAVRVSDHIGRRDPGIFGEEEPDDASEQDDAISRLGGDEFTVLLTEVAQPGDAALVAERLLGTLEAPVVLAGKEVFVSTSIGIAVFPEDGRDSESLLRNADAAMYFAKGRGRNRYQFYTEEMNRTHSSRIEIEARLRGAIEREELALHYQPILDSVTGEIVAAEALLRWTDAELGFVPPDEFIPVAEETGLIVSLGRWVFRTACGQARIWRDAGLRPIRIGVNVSGYQIREPGMLEMVRAALEETNVSPDQIELEITESTIMQDDALTVKTLREFREMGLGLALDDFGTGYSSLSYLRRFTIDRVKVDRSFVAELTENADDAALTSAIIAMAHGLRLKVVAEGVETRAQALFLEQRGCDELQGYLFGRPCAADEFVDLLRARPLLIRDLEKDES